jgi:hypothetical protein
MAKMSWKVAIAAAIERTRSATQGKG